MRNSRSLSAFASLCVTVATFVGGACSGPGLSVNDWQPGPVDTGAEHRLFLAPAWGPREGLYATRDIAADAARARRWFTLCDDDDHALSLRLDVLEWFTETSQEARPGTDDEGNAVSVLVDVESAHAYLGATLTDAAGRVLLDGYEVEGIHSEDVSGWGYEDEDAMLDAAAKSAVDQVMNQITPTSDEVFLPFDDRDETERPFLDQAQKGRLAGAIDLETAFIADHHGLAAPLYNRAVMLEASGDFDAALNGYDDALAASPDDKLRALAVDARAGCVERRQNARALGL